MVVILLFTLVLTQETVLIKGENISEIVQELAGPVGPFGTQQSQLHVNVAVGFAFTVVSIQRFNFKDYVLSLTG